MEKRELAFRIKSLLARREVMVLMFVVGLLIVKRILPFGEPVGREVDDAL